jgi:hypothetical protein
MPLILFASTTHSQVLLNILMGVQLLRMFVFRELIQNATHERAAIELHDFKDAAKDVAVAAKSVEHKLEEAAYSMEHTIEGYFHHEKNNHAKEAVVKHY